MSKSEEDFSRGFATESMGATREELANMSDEELALWQATPHQHAPARGILAQQEWTRRHAANQRRTAYVIAAIGILGVVLGTVLGWYLRSFGPS